MKESPKKPESRRPNNRRPTAKQAAFVTGILDGKSGRRAAIDAGYAPSSADHATTDILPAVERAFAPALREAIPVEHIIKRLREGLDAQVVRIATFEGKITDESAYTDFAERRAYAELIVKIGGHYVPTERLETPGIQISSDELIQKIIGAKGSAASRSEEVNGKAEA